MAVTIKRNLAPAVRPRVERKRTPVAGELSVAQRRVIDRSIAKGLEDARMGRVYGPFETVDEMAASIEAEVSKRKSARKPARSG